MRLVVQRVADAQVRVDDEIVGEIGAGLLALVGVSRRDTLEVVHWAADKLAQLRLFADASKRMSLNLEEIGGAILVVSQFTLYGDVRRGLRPDFGGAAPAALARPLYEAFVDRLKEKGCSVQTGVFGAHMQVRLTNDGPVTLSIDTDEVMPSGL